MESLLGVEVLLCVLILILYVFCAQWIENTKFDYLHESSLAIGLGVVAGMLLYWVGDREQVAFDSSVFFYFVLPPIIFAAGYNLKSQNFFINLGFISLYGLVGTFLSFMCLALLATFFNANGALPPDLRLTTKECLLFASVLCATDTIAAISVIKEDKYPQLHSIVFGEGVINDAVSIALFRAVENIFTSDEVSFGAMEGVRVAGSFLAIMVFSVVVGAAFGFLSALVLKRTPGINEFPTRETTLIILNGYLSYTVAELLDLSGIVTIFCCGVVMAHYTYYNISPVSQQGTTLAFDVLAHGAEAFTYTYLGLSITALRSSDWPALFIVCMLVAIVLARAASILISSAIVFIAQRGSFGLESKSICVTWFAGLIRGSVAFALALQISGPHSGVLVSSTMGIVLATTFGLNSIVTTFTKYVGVTASTQSRSYLELLASPESFFKKEVDKAGMTWFHRKFTEVNERWLKPVFGGESRPETKPNVWEKLWVDEEVELSDASVVSHNQP
jgi:sodium/hydrogen exchanger 3